MAGEINENVTAQEGEITGYTLEAADIVYASVDATLSVSGKAADAKATGDALRAVASLNSDGDIVIKTL